MILLPPVPLFYKSFSATIDADAGPQPVIKERARAHLLAPSPNKFSTRSWTWSVGLRHGPLGLGVC